MSTPRRLAPSRALVLFVVYAVVFALGGGLAAGVMVLVFAQIGGGDMENASQVYAISFGVCGWIAYRLAQRVAEG